MKALVGLQSAWREEIVSWVRRSEEQQDGQPRQAPSFYLTLAVTCVAKITGNSRHEKIRGDSP
ncbi:hypothetical protein E2C01_061544 [Portunus trituberculatus]|uniref:Uncharacterized protein n=1 Tax=Portunus trituberculatus TaxID=210409 RepID=A0A5B7HBX8_PORTR|nr:hypothetical protein [Portunus trituberculatus]